MGKLKKNGKKIKLLRAIDKCGEHGFTTDRQCCPPAKIMKPLIKRGWVYSVRVPYARGWGTYYFGSAYMLKITKWFLTPEGKKALNA